MFARPWSVSCRNSRLLASVSSQRAPYASHVSSQFANGPAMYHHAPWAQEAARASLLAAKAAAADLVAAAAGSEEEEEAADCRLKRRPMRVPKALKPRNRGSPRSSPGRCPRDSVSMV